MNISNSDVNKFWYFVDKTENCWIYTASRTKDGYGKFSFFDKEIGKQRTSRAHRLSYELKNGPIKQGLFVCHKCDNPPCVNPDHLFLGTVQDNADDMVSKGRAWSILNKTDVLYIKKCLNNKTCNKISLAKRFKVSVMTIESIHLGKNWRHVQCP